MQSCTSTDAAIARAFNISVRSMKYVGKVIRLGIPEMDAAIMAGKPRFGIVLAATVVDYPGKVQRRFLAVCNEGVRPAAAWRAVQREFGIKGKPATPKIEIPDDARLHCLLLLWPKLTDAQKDELLTTAGGMADENDDE